MIAVMIITGIGKQSFAVGLYTSDNKDLPNSVFEFGKSLCRQTIYRHSNLVLKAKIVPGEYEDD